MLLKWIERFLSVFKRVTHTDELRITATIPFGNPTRNTVADQQLLLVRDRFTDVSTTGELRDNGTLVCYILEDAVRRQKIAKITAIPMGTYEIKITRSPRFSKAKRPVPFLPELLRVRGYTGVRIHHGNSIRDTDGCLLVGLERSVNWVSDSRRALAKTLWLIRKKLRKGRLWLTITGGGQNA